MTRTPRSVGALASFALLLALCLAAPGCRRGQTSTEVDEAGTGGSDGTSTEPGPPPADWPRILVVGPGTGPALYLGAEESAPAVGYLNPGVRIRLESAPSNGRIEALVAGPMATKAWIPLSRVAAYAQERGRVEGTRAYLGPNDLVGIMGTTGDQMRIEVRPWLGGANVLGPFVGTFPRDKVAAEQVEGAEGVSDGQCYRLPAGQTLPVYEQPSTAGTPTATLPALDPPLPVVVLRERGGWFGVRAGYGPYLTGYVQGQLTPCQGAMPAPEPMSPASGGERPYWMSQENGALHRVAPGTRVRFHGHTIARLREQGWARELGRQDGGMVDVFVAVNDDVALRGLVPEDSLTLVEGQPTAPTRAPEPEEELPDELQ